MKQLFMHYFLLRPFHSLFQHSSPGSAI